MSLFSAIITTRNRKELLEKAIESVLSQTVKDVECVVVQAKRFDPFSDFHVFSPSFF